MTRRWLALTAALIALAGIIGTVPPEHRATVAVRALPAPSYAARIEPRPVQPPRAGRSRQAPAPKRKGKARTGGGLAWQTLPGKPTSAGLAILGNCEARSQGYTTNTGNGYYGRYQFHLRTWRSFWSQWGYPSIAAVRPDRAPPAQQDDAVRRIIRGGSSPYRQWPGCSRAHPGWWLR